MPYVSAAEKSGEKPTLQAVHDLLTLDRRFQAVVFKYIGIFEMQLRASYSDAMAKIHSDSLPVPGIPEDWRESPIFGDAQSM